MTEQTCICQIDEDGVTLRVLTCPVHFELRDGWSIMRNVEPPTAFWPNGTKPKWRQAKKVRGSKQIQE